MYSFDLSKLNGYDWYLIGLYTYDANPYNLYYVICKAANFDVHSLPDNELAEVGKQFYTIARAYLTDGQKGVEAWANELSKPIQYDPDTDFNALFWRAVRDID